MHAFDILGDHAPAHSGAFADGERTSGAITDVIPAESAISQPAVSQHLRVRRDSGFASVRAEGTRRLHAVEPEPLSEIDAWLDRFRRVWEQRLDALGTEPARGRRAGRTQAGFSTEPGKTDPLTEGDMT